MLILQVERAAVGGEQAGAAFEGNVKDAVGLERVAKAGERGDDAGVG